MMKKLLCIVFLMPFLVRANDIKIPTKIKEVTVYLSGAQITRSTPLQLNAGSNTVIFTGLSPRLDESSIQIAGLQSVSVLSMQYNINYLSVQESNPELQLLEGKIIELNQRASLLKNDISGLEEEQKVINANRLISGENLALDLEKIKQISTYYRERTTAIKNQIFRTTLKINELSLESNALQSQLAELNNAPTKEQGEIHIKFDAPIDTSINLELAYTIQDAGWIPNYDIKSKQLNAPLQLTYKAHVYQKSGIDWNNVKISLSSGSPTVNVAKPTLGVKYLDFISSYAKRYGNTTKKQKYFHNPMVKKVVGQVTDASGSPLPGANILIKGTTRGTTSDFDGNYSLDVTSGKELVISYIGFKSEEVPIYSSIINISLEEDANMLEEVVVTAYGTQRSSNLTAARSIQLSSNQLQGRAAGISIRGNPTIKTRGNSSIPRPRNPMYVIDGVPVEGFEEGDIDFDEIQSIEVLKGENAIVLYGSRANNGIILITTKKSTLKEGVTNTRFEIKKKHSITSNGDITAIELNGFQLEAVYTHFAAPIINENVFMTASFKDWEQYNLLPGEANVYFEGRYAGKTTIDPYTTKKEMTLSLGIDPNVTVMRNQQKNFKSKSFTGNNRVLDRTYELEVKNNKSIPIDLHLMDRIPLSQNKEIKVDDLVTNTAEYDKKKGLLSWKLKVAPKQNSVQSFSFQVKYPKYRTISL